MKSPEDTETSPVAYDTASFPKKITVSACIDLNNDDGVSEYFHPGWSFQKAPFTVT